MPKAAKILVIRFSAMGDVAMTAPILKQFEEKYPDISLLVVSRSHFQPFFAETNADFYHFEPKGRHKGFLGLIKLFFELRREKITIVADLHNNLRSKIITCLFFIAGIRSARVDKGRKEKRLLTRKHNKQLIPLKPTLQRYADVFKRLGFPLEISNNLHVQNKELRRQKMIGVSPFAQHLQKVYPAHKMESVIVELANLDHLVYIFGGSVEEQVIAEAWAEKHPNIQSIVKKMTLPEELELISQLDMMLSMDSSGMHMASLKNIPVVSIWGATHPYLGFLGYGQSISNAVQIDLYCRPCSVYGNVPCYRGDLACMNNLLVSAVVEKVLNELNKPTS
jgi:ADP-heptose:LPS heptosyltransferase